MVKMAKKVKNKNIGYDVKPPERECDDVNCPFHGKLSLRGNVFQGTVVSDKMSKSIVIERNYLHFVPKYERYERRRKRIAAHNPDCIDAKKGDTVKIAECRPISKTKHFVVIEKVSK
jgi:small subunit ribosomal protein S17